MKEYVLWGTDPRTGFEMPISEKVYDLETQRYRESMARKNGWKNVHTQVIDLSKDNTAQLFKKSVKVIRK